MKKMLSAILIVAGLTIQCSRHHRSYQWISGIALWGRLDQDGGQVDVSLDGKLHRAIDTYYSEKRDPAFIWHALGLDPGSHEIRVVVKGEKKSQGSAARIHLSGAEIYQKKNIF